jgi:hypothetical protein
MSQRSQSGRALGSILLFLVLVSGAGAWNYHRNWQIEKESEAYRPYSGYKVPDLESLREAFASELNGSRTQFDAAKRKRVRPKRDLGSMTDNVAQFQRTAETSNAIRDAAAGVADREGQIAELDRELGIRNRFGEGMMRHVKLLTTI